MSWLKTSLGKKFYNLYQSIPTLRSFSDEVKISYQDLTLEERQEMLGWLDKLIDKLENQLKTWKSLRKTINGDKGLKLLK